MPVYVLDQETDITDQFLDPETDIMGEGNFMGFKYHLMNYISPCNTPPWEILPVGFTNKRVKKFVTQKIPYSVKILVYSEIPFLSKE